MLIRPRRLRMAQHDWLARCHSTDAVRDDAVSRIVAAADDIPCARRRNRHAPVRKETALVTVGHKLRTTLAIRVRVITIERIRLAIAPSPFIIVIHLVRRHVQYRLHGRALPHAFEHVHRAHHIRRVRRNRIAIALSHDGLCRKMQHDVRARVIECFLQHREIAHIANHGMHVREPCLRKQVLRRGLQAVPCDLRAYVKEHAAEPAPLESRVPRDENAFAAIKSHVFPAVQSFHTFHGGFPSSQSFSKRILSRSVSMHCQKPSCR